MITLPVGFDTGLTTGLTTLFADISPLLLIAVGIPFGVYVIRKIISLIPKK
jgi:hypothetical protein